MSYVIDTHTQTSKIVHINSLDATTSFSSGLTTDFDYELEQPIKCPENQIILVSCIGATIPYTFYNIRTNVNNRICVRLTESGTIYNINIPAGNYTSTSLLLKIKELFDGLAITETINITYNRTTMLFDFTITGGSGTCWFDFTTEANPYPLNVELGFPLAKTQLTTNTPSPNVADVNGTIHGLYIRSDISTNSIYDSESKSLSGILSRIPIRVNFGGIIFWDTADGSGHKAQLDNQLINKIRIRLTDDRNRLIDLNGLNFSITLLFDFVYKKSQIQPLSKETRRIRELHLEHKAREKHQRLHKKDKSKGGRPRKVGRPKKTN
tara:strand:+ start:2248 stop:3216 length:969 start_codon:yes stop_codon:yes gene_type:complete